MFTFIHYTNSQDEHSEQQAGSLDNNAVLIGFVESPEQFDKMLMIVRQRYGSDRKREDDGMWSNKQSEIINDNAQIINLASGSNLTVGEGLESCTYEVNVALDFELDGRVVKLIDTPGFDDTNRSDTDILATIASHLEKACVVLLRLILMGLLGGLGIKPG